MNASTNRPPILLGAIWTQGALATVFTAARFYVRLVVEPNVGWDDWTMLIALVSLTDYVLGNRQTYQFLLSFLISRPQRS